tara:strand:+ start:358 stop:654 length:297 start_codon:yes stop_codon:yes gene_type:complete
MVTGSNTIPQPGSAGNFNSAVSLFTGIVNNVTTVNPTNFSGLLEDVPVTSTSGGSGATVDITFIAGTVTTIVINQIGSGYSEGGGIFISAADINNYLP